MYKIKGKKALAHSTYVRPDRKQVMTMAKHIAEKNGISFSRFITEIVHDFVTGKLVSK